MKEGNAPLSANDRLDKIDKSLKRDRLVLSIAMLFVALSLMLNAYHVVEVNNSNTDNLNKLKQEIAWSDGVLLNEIDLVEDKVDFSLRALHGGGLIALANESGLEIKD